MVDLGQERTGECSTVFNGQDVTVFGEAEIRKSAKRHDFASRHDGNGLQFKSPAAAGCDRK